MLNAPKCLLAVLFLALVSPFAHHPSAAAGPRYTADGRMLPPTGYREWIFLSSGIDMSYNPRAAAANRSVFDNVFVNPEAYRAFLQTGTWPDKTVLVLEVRAAQSKGSINRAGHFQNVEMLGLEVHVKDEARFSGNWAFFDFEGDKPAKRISPQASCYSCHRRHAAVDTTFVQFYPTLLPIAEKMKTLSPAYVKETAVEGKNR